jgi:hypothetical protein
VQKFSADGGGLARPTSRVEGQTSRGDFRTRVTTSVAGALRLRRNPHPDGRPPREKLSDPAYPPQLAAVLAQGTIEGLRERAHWPDVEHLLLFAGHGRSGHSLVGSLLNAHPEMVVSHELGLLRYARHHVPRTTLYGLILKRDRDFGTIGRRWGKYDYSVPNQYQGRFTRLRVIGDKRGAHTNIWATGYPSLLPHLRRTVRVPLRFLHVTRNPFDSISSLGREKYMTRDVDEVIARFRERCEQTENTRSQLNPGEMLDVNYEEFVADPYSGLTRICGFLGLTASQSYLDDCASLIRPSGSKKSRQRVQWTSEQIHRVEQMIEHFPSLAGYTLDS